MRRIVATAAQLPLLILAGCAGNGEGLDTNGNPISGEPEPLQPELQSIQDHVFTPICTACHAGAGAPLGFKLDANSAYAMLVNAPSVEVPSLMRVSPGNPDQSYIIQKLEGHAAVGGQMPLGGPPLPQATIDVIRQWITDGAQPKAAAANVAATNVAAPTSVQAIAPLENEQLAQPPREILIAADGELDTSLLDSGVVTLTRSGGDGSFADGNEVAIEGLAITVRSVSPTVLAIQVPANGWTPDRYELRLAGQGPLHVANRAGLAIDGAGTGKPGTDFVLTFTLESTR